MHIVITMIITVDYRLDDCEFPLSKRIMVLTTFQSLAIGYAAALVLTWLWSVLRAPGFRVAGKHVFITGGNSGLGLETAKIYALAGAKVTIVARDAARLEEAKRQIESSFRSDVAQYPVLTIPCDVTDYSAMQAAVATANAFHQRVTDHVICNAGISTPGLLLDQEPDAYRRIMDINYFGTLHTIKAALPAMVSTSLAASEARRRVVVVSSAAGLVSFVGYSQYSSTKFAQRGLAESMRNELQLYDIDVCIYHPGNFDTPLLSADHDMKPEATKKAVALSRTGTAEGAAKALVKGIASGQYAFSNEFLADVLRLAASGTVPRANPLLDLLMQPLVMVLCGGYYLYLDVIVKLEARKRKQSHQ